MPLFFSHDGAHYQYEQGPYDWKKIRQASADPENAVAIYKLSQSLNYKDPFRRRFRDEAHAAGFKYILFYHWLSSVTDPSDQAHHMIQTLWDDEPLVEGEGFMLDDEEGGVTIAKTLEWKYETLRNIERDAVAIYTGAYVAGIWQSPLVFDADTLGVLAAYTSEAKMLALPGVHNHLPDIWQYSSSGKMPDGSQLPGVTGRADMNMHYQENNVKRRLDVICGVKPKVKPLPVPPVVTTPSKEDDMATVVTQIQGRNAQFVGNGSANSDGSWHCREVEWFGPGGSAYVNAVSQDGNVKRQTLTEAALSGMTLLGNPEEIEDNTGRWDGSEFRKVIRYS